MKWVENKLINLNKNIAIYIKMCYIFIDYGAKKSKKGDVIMARCPRIKTNTNVYHVIIRGINRQDIFLDNQDYRKFIKELKRVKSKYEFEIYSYALMKNHIHLVMNDKNKNLSTSIQSLNISYSSYFNKKYERIGHLFENRFKSHTIESETYLKNVVRYIHKNPENACLKPYMWTSYYEYIMSKYNKICTTKQVMNLFANNLENFKAFHDNYEKNQDYDKDFEMPGRLQEDEAIKIIKEIINEPNLMKIQNYEMTKKKEVLNKIMRIEGITKVQVSRITGISKSIIDRMIKNEVKGTDEAKRNVPNTSGGKNGGE